MTKQRGRWGKAGQRLTEDETRAAAQAAGKARLRRQADDGAAYRLWQAGELRPHRITMLLNAHGLYGPEVDEACGASEPDVDLWEAGKLYPTWEQVKLLAGLVGVTPLGLLRGGPEIRVESTSLRFHVPDYEEEPTVWRFEPEAIAATVGQPRRRHGTTPGSIASPTPGGRA